MTNVAEPALDPRWSEGAGGAPAGDKPKPISPNPAAKPIDAGASEYKALPYPQYAGEKKKWGLAPSFKKKGELREEVPSTDLKFRPWVSICLLRVTYRSNKRASATGFLINSAMVATSAHVLYNPDPALDLAAKIEVIPGYLQPENHRFSQTALTFAWNREWGGVPDNFRAAYDYGVIKLPKQTDFSSFGRLVLRAPSDADLKKNLTISGYPGEFTGQPAQMRHSGRVIEEPGELSVYHNIMTSPGQSGSPMFFIAGSETQVIGIHSKESSDMPGANVARRVTDDMIADYKRWAAEFGVRS